MNAEVIARQPFKKRCIVYIDGYNWHHAIFKHQPDLKWLNAQAFFETLQLDDNVIAVKHFSAMLNAQPDSDARERQTKYFNALRTLAKVKIKRIKHSFQRGVFGKRRAFFKSIVGSGGGSRPFCQAASSGGRTLEIG